MGITRFFGRMFGSSKAIEEVAGATAKGLDKLIHTSQEKAELNLKEREMVSGVFVEWMRNSQGQNLARRFMATVFVGVWVFGLMCYVGLSIAGVWSEDPSNYIEAAEMIKSTVVEVKDFAEIILIYYFAAPHLSKFIESRSKK